MRDEKKRTTSITRDSLPDFAQSNNVAFLISNSEYVINVKEGGAKQSTSTNLIIKLFAWLLQFALSFFYYSQELSCGCGCGCEFRCVFFSFLATHTHPHPHPPSRGAKEGERHFLLDISNGKMILFATSSSIRCSSTNEPWRELHRSTKCSSPSTLESVEDEQQTNRRKRRILAETFVNRQAEQSSEWDDKSSAWNFFRTYSIVQSVGFSSFSIGSTDFCCFQVKRSTISRGMTKKQISLIGMGRSMFTSVDRWGCTKWIVLPKNHLLCGFVSPIDNRMNLSLIGEESNRFHCFVIEWCLVDRLFFSACWWLERQRSLSKWNEVNERSPLSNRFRERRRNSSNSHLSTRSAVASLEDCSRGDDNLSIDDISLLIHR